MKKYVCCFLIFIGMAGAFAQNYYLITDHGTVSWANSSGSIEPGTLLKPDDKIAFQTAASYAVVVDEGLSRYFLRLPSNPGPGPWQYTVSQVLSLCQEKSAQRGFVKVERSVQNLGDYFGNRFTVIGDSLAVRLDPSKYPMNNNTFLVFYYPVEGDYHASKKIGFNNQLLILEKEKLMHSKGHRIHGNWIENIEVYWYNYKEKSSVKITEMELYFMPEAAIKAEMEALRDVMEKIGKAPSGFSSYAKDYFSDVYGQADPLDLNRLAGF